ncbi:MAG: hypothetical protein ACLP7W_10415 [Solirubrobacteraceae bacterium]
MPHPTARRRASTASAYGRRPGDPARAGRHSFELWTGVQPPLDVMRRALYD